MFLETIAKKSFVTLKLFCIPGKETAALVIEGKSTGTYKVEFSRQLTIYNKQLSSGIYFYRLQAGVYTQTKKMIYLK